MTYRRYVSILHLQWKYTWKAFAGIILLLCAGEGYFFYQRLIHTDYQIEANESINNWDATLKPWAPRFEEFLAQSHFKALFLTAILLTLILLISIPIRQNMSTKTDYMYLRLPIPRIVRPITSGVHTLSHLVILLRVQFGMILIGYQMYLEFIPKEAQMTQALFLAFFRWDFLRTVFPISNVMRFIYNLFVLISIVISVVYVQICIETKHKNIIPIVVNGYIYTKFYELLYLSTMIKYLIILTISILVMIYYAKDYLEEENERR